MITRIALTLFVLGASWAAGAAPIRSTATAHVGARILAPLVIVEAPALPARVTFSAEDVARGYALVSVAASATRLALASGDRDIAPPEPSREGVLTIRAGAAFESVELVRHIE